jgi:hypothetical protein
MKMDVVLKSFDKYKNNMVLDFKPIVDMKIVISVSEYNYV